MSPERASGRTRPLYDGRFDVNAGSPTESDTTVSAALSGGKLRLPCNRHSVQYAAPQPLKGSCELYAFRTRRSLLSAALGLLTAVAISTVAVADPAFADPAGDTIPAPAKVTDNVILGSST